MKTIIDQNLFKTHKRAVQEEGNWQIRAGSLKVKGVIVIVWQVGVIDENGKFEPYYTAPNFESIASWMEANHFNVQGESDCGPDEYTVDAYEDEGFDGYMQ